jgi:hypothetical protein
LSRFGILLSLTAASILHAADPPAPCKIREIAFVQAFIGTWHDVTYNSRVLIKNLEICSDSELVRVKDGKQSEMDQLVLKDLFGGEPIAFKCADLLSCEQPIQLATIKDKLQQRLRGKTPGESFEEFKRSHAGQTSTISRSSVVSSRDGRLEDPWFQGAVVEAGEPLSPSALAPSGVLGYNAEFDLCLNADKHDCGMSLPKASKYQANASALPFGPLPPGLHMLYRVKTLDGDTVPLRTEDHAFVLAVDPSQRESGVEEIKANLALAWMDPQSTPAQLNDYVSYLASKFIAKPNK